MKHKIQKESGFPIRKKAIPTLQKKHFFVDPNNYLGGDRPKDLIRIYQKGARISNKKTWVPYIAKFGDKWYPNESLTEYLMNQFGEELGLNMAKSKVLNVHEQIRFCSQIFTTHKTSLVHGAQIYASWLNNDMEFVQGAEQSENELFTFQFAESAIKHYLNEAGCQSTTFQEVMERLVELLTFDALIGNNDRHLYNWGLVTHSQKSTEVRFSPIFDTSRGLLWNTHESKLKDYLIDKSRFEKYINDSKPKMGWDDCKNLNHFDFISKLVEHYPHYCGRAAQLLQRPAQACLHQVISKKCHNFFSPQRVQLLSLIFAPRYERLTILFKPLNTPA
jgi:HipA-like C-terminal domain